MIHSAQQTPICHTIERLLDWCMPVVERLPKSLPYQRVGARIIDKTLESLDLASLAYDSINVEARVNYLGYLITDIRTVGGLHDALHRLDVACAEMLKAPSYDRSIRLMHCIQSVNSCLGFMVHTSSYNIRLAMVGGHKNITLCCYYKNKHLIVEAKKKYQPKNYLHGMDYQFAVALAGHC